MPTDTRLADATAAPPDHYTGRTQRRVEIASIGEFVDCLERLLKGHLLVCIGTDARHWTLDGAPVHWSRAALMHAGLLEPVRVRGAAVGVTHYGLSEHGRVFGDRVLARWRSLPLWRRGLLRLVA